MGKYDWEAPDNDEIFKEPLTDNYKELAEKWDYVDFRKRLTKYNINIEEFAEKSFLSKKDSHELVTFTYYSSVAKLKRAIFKSLKHDLAAYKDSPEKEKEVKQAIGKVKILQNPQDILDIITNYQFPGEPDKKLAFNNFEDYLEYIFEHK